MSNHIKIWLPEEDEQLRSLVEGISKPRWSIIAKKLEQEFRVFGRTGKQCRERWVNYLRPALKHGQWTQEDDQLLFDLHDTYGNKWSLISKQLNGRPDNSIKNRFYSTLRKGLRRVNYFISLLEGSSASQKPIKNQFVSKLVNGGLQRRVQSTRQKETNIIRELIFFSRVNPQKAQTVQPRLIELLDCIHEISRVEGLKKVKLRGKKEKVTVKLENSQQEASDNIQMSPSAETVQDQVRKAELSAAVFHNPTLFSVPQLNLNSNQPLVYFVMPQPTIFYAFSL